jgi:hypothetical protein
MPILIITVAVYYFRRIKGHRWCGFAEITNVRVCVALQIVADVDEIEEIRLEAVQGNS